MQNRLQRKGVELGPLVKNATVTFSTNDNRVQESG